ncbi:MAG: DUF1564 family protein [Leptospiraceae bacterium]|nr:DUF1564 family protein [Leptospiraceae bacterium]
MRTFTLKNQHNFCENLTEPSSTSTLLIPLRHMEVFRQKLKKFDGNLSLYLSHLLNRYRFLIQNGYIPTYEFLKTGYQEKKQDLQRVDFVPAPEDWAELKCLRVFLNRSMTWIFVFLLKLDSLDLDKHLPKKLAGFVVPKVSSLRLDVKSIFSRKKLYYDRILRMTRDRAG